MRVYVAWVYSRIDHDSLQLWRCFLAHKKPRSQHMYRMDVTLTDVILSTLSRKKSICLGVKNKLHASLIVLHPAENIMHSWLSCSWRKIFCYLLLLLIEKTPSNYQSSGNKQYRSMAPIPHQGGPVYMGAPVYFQQGNYGRQYGLPYQNYGWV
jgi:hypothetical protein